MKDLPILFSGAMVRALLASTKTQTRRAIKCPESITAFRHFIEDRWDRMQGAHRGDSVRCPYGQPGDRLWVREAWRTVAEADAFPPRDLNEAHRIWHEADEPHQPGFGKLRPSIHMPRWASRITLEVTEVRVERLQDISEHDAAAEGVATWAPGALSPEGQTADPSDQFRWLWDSINRNGPHAWDANPWVWAVSFKVVKGGGL